MNRQASSDEPARPALRGGVAVMVMPHAVQLRAGDEQIVILHTDHPPRLAELLGRCDGTRDRDALRQAAGPDAELLDDALRELLGHDLLIDGAPHDDDPIARYLGHFTGEPAAMIDALRGARIAVVGDAPIATVVAAIIQEHGPAADCIATRDDPLDAMHEPAALIVCAWERPDLTFVEAVNAAACRRRVPCLFADLSHGRHATIGPFFIPGESACYACMLQRLHENTAAFPERIAAEQQMRDTRTPLPAYGLLPAHRHHAAAVAASEAVALFTRHRPLRTLSRIITIDLEQLHTTSEPAWRIPWCDTCAAPGRDDFSRPAHA